MPTPLRDSGLRVALLAVVALAATAVTVAFAAGESAARDGSGALPAAAWKGLVGGPRPEVTVGQRVIVVLRVPSLADRLAAHGRARDRGATETMDTRSRSPRRSS